MLTFAWNTMSAKMPNSTGAKKKLRSQNSQQDAVVPLLGVPLLRFFCVPHRFALTCLTTNSKQKSEIFGPSHGGFFRNDFLIHFFELSGLKNQIF